MKCPNDDTTLVMSERSGVEIDYCPQCRGVWLDRGELDKILDRAASEQASAAPPQPEQPVAPGYGQTPYREPRYDERSSHGGHGDRRASGGQYPKRKESWLSGLFD